MAKRKYFYNTETCKYEKVRIKPKDVIFNTLGLLTASVLFAVAIMVTFNYYFDTPSEARLKKENRELGIHLTSLESSLGEINETIEFLKKRDLEIFKDIYESSPDNSEIEIKSSVGQLIESFYESGLNNKRSVNSFKDNLTKLNRRARTEIYEAKNLLRITNNKKLKLEYIPTIQPIKNDDLNALVSGYGKRVNPYHHGVVMHEGIDFSAPRGTPVYSTAKGTVQAVKTKDNGTGYGKYVEISHGDLTTKYAHLSDIVVKRRNEVEKGELIGYVGNSGGTIAPCVHYEIARNGKKINPVNFMIEGLSEKEYLRLLELSLRKGKSLD